MSAALIAKALYRAVLDLPTRQMRRPLIASLLWTAASFLILWAIVAFLLHRLLAGYAWAEAASAVLGIFAVPAITFALFPIVATLFLSFYVDTVIDAIEERYYPDLLPAPPTRWMDQLRALVMLAVISLALNIVALPFYLFVPGANLILFISLNGYLLGRGNYELVALRRHEWAAARARWHRERLDFTLLGAILTGIFSVPFANLLAPVIGVAAAVHLFETAGPTDDARTTGPIREYQDGNVWPD